MSEDQAAKKGHNVSVISFVTRKLIGGPKGEFSKKIGQELSIKLNTKVSDTNHVNIRGEARNVQVAEKLILQLDQKAEIIAKNALLKTTGQIEDIHYESLNLHLNTLLTQAKRELSAKPSVTVEIASAPTLDDAAKTQLAGTFEAVAEKPKGPTPPKAKIAKHGLKTQYEPRNISQAIGYTAIQDPDIDVAIYSGAAGGGKTHLAIAAGLEIVASGRATALEIYRPDQGAGNKQGAVPGDIQKKEEVFLSTISDSLYKLTGADLKSHLKNGTVKEAGTPVRKRGANFEHTVAIIDEAQNLTIDQSKMLLTRIAEGAKVIMTGDISSHQNDLRGRCPGLAHLITAQGIGFNNGDLKTVKHMAFVEFFNADSEARHRLLPSIHTNYDNLPPYLANALVDMEQVPEKVAKATEIFMQAAKDNLTQAAKTTYARFEAAAKQRFPDVFGIPARENVVDFPRPALMVSNP